MKELSKLKELSSSIKLDKTLSIAVLNNTLDHAKNENNHNKSKDGMVADEAASNLLKGSTEKLNEQINHYQSSFKNMVSMQVQMLESAKLLTQKSKDYSNQVGEALARIDKVLVKDFESKLLLLERFVIASKEMAELEKTGALQKIAISFK